MSLINQTVLNNSVLVCCIVNCLLTMDQYSCSSCVGSTPNEQIWECGYISFRDLIVLCIGFYHRKCLCNIVILLCCISVCGIGVVRGQ